MNRRQALAYITPVAAGPFGFAACGERQQSQGTFTASAYDEQVLHAKLEEMRLVFERRFPGAAKSLLPGLSEDEIRRKTAWFPEQLPAEVIGLYKWRNGYLDQASSKEPPFWFRDYVFTPLEKAESHYRSMIATYGTQSDVREVLKSAFPFASLGGGWLVVPSERRPLNSKYPRGIVSVFQGVSVFFYSAALMAETCAAWMAHPGNNGFGLSSKEEMKVWQQFNPGIFKR
jgi:hypothetical protein